MRCHYWIFNTRNIRETIDSFTRGSYYHLFKRCVNSVHKNADRDQNEGVLGFSVLRFQLFFRSVFLVFVPKNFGFSVLVFIAVCGYTYFQHLVFGFLEKYQRVFGFDIRCSFRIWYPMRFSISPIWPFWVPVSLRSERQLRASTNLE